MKKIIILLSIVLMLFLGTWAVKAQSPLERPDSYANGIDADAGMWWSVRDTETVSSDWILDPEIPENYLPVPGEEELYMVIDSEGNILCYRQRIKQEDGSWLWADVNPDIPDHYEPVDGLEDVYKVTAADGTISYFKYIRNEDDTFAFFPVDENGNPLEEQPIDGTEIPENYRHITGNIYAVLNENNVIIGYRERRLNEDGTYTWVDCEKPEIKVDNSGETEFNSSPGLTVPDISGAGSGTGNSPNNDNGTGSGTGAGSTVNIPGNDYPSGEVVKQRDGTYVETETIINSETAGGWTTTYQTIVTRVYSSEGVLLSTKKDGPHAISKVQASTGNNQAPDKSLVAGTIGEELARVSTGINFRGDIASNILNLLNEERLADGKNMLTMDTNSDAYKIAQIRAADMAIYNHSDYNSPTYGTVNDILRKYGITSAMPSENIWKTTTGNEAGAVHSRFMTLDGARGSRMNEQYTRIGIAVVEKNGYLYICEILYD